MRLRALGVTGLLLVGLSLLALCNAAPTMEDQYVTTVQDEPATFEIRAEDTDIDPIDPTAHPLTFSVLHGPSHGVLIGELTNVVYRAPHIAAVEVTYVPADGYVGSDYVTVEVTDPHGEIAMGTTTVEILVEARRTMGILSGNWSTEVTYNTQTGGFTAFRTQFTAVYRVGNLALKSVAFIKMETNAGVKEMLFDSLRFQGDYSIFGIDHTSTLAFDPSAAMVGMFEYWLTSTRFTIADVDFAHTLYLLDTQADSYQALSAQASIGSVSMTNSLRFDLDPSCSFVFASNDTSILWTWCDITLRASIGFTCDGFEALTLGAGGVPIPGLAWLPGDVVLDTTVTFDMDGKSLSTSVDWRPGAISCFKLLAELDLSGPGPGPVAGDTIINSLAIYGIKVECDLPGAFGDISFVSATALDSSYNSIVTGQTDYFEVLRLSGPLQACCGYPGSWSMATYFNTSSAKLFDWGMTLIRADIVISNHFNFSFETVFRSGFFGDPKLELTVGWMTRW